MTYVLEFLLEQLHHVFLNNQSLLIKIFDDDIVVNTIQVNDDGLDGWFALDEYT